MLNGNASDGLLLLGLAVCIVILPIKSIGSPRKRQVQLVAVALVALQLVFEGPRIQLLPAYLIALAFAIRSVPLSRSGVVAAHRTLTKNLARWALVLGAGFLLAISALYCLALPRFEYPKPSGVYEVGVHRLHLVDPSRSGLGAPGADHRELMVRVTYPTAMLDSVAYKKDVVANAAAASPNAALRTLKPNTFWASLFPESWGRVRTNAWLDKPLATAQPTYPVLIFSHGLVAWPEQYIVVTEELASHGYIVVAINHQDLSGRFERPDGSIDGVADLMRRQNAIPFSSEQRAKLIALEKKLSAAGENVAAQIRILKEGEGIRPELSALIAGVNRLAAADQRFVIGALNDLQANDPVLKARLDLDRLGVFGMSLGGIASHITCAEDPRCRAGLNMDGFQTQMVDLPPLKVPFMHMSNEHSLLGLISHDRAEAPSYVVRVKGSAHGSYSDFSLVAPRLRQLDKRGIPVMGKIEGERMRSIINDYTVAFFDKHLLKKEAPLLDSPSDQYPEVVFLSK